jgi:hypothetical protein
MNQDQFKEYLAKDLLTIKQRHASYSNDGQRFTHWVLENVFLLSDMDARASNYDGPDDGGLDGFFIDESDNLVRIIQCKYSENIEREDRESFITLPHKLDDPERIAETNPRIYDCSKQYCDYVKRNFDLYLAFVFIGQNRPEYTDELKRIIQKSLPPELKERFVIEVIGIDELIIKFLSTSPFGINIPESKILEYTGDQLLTYEAGDIKAIVATVNGKNLASFGNSPDMFLANFRYFLDLRNRINNKIAETIQAPIERDKTWTYNNGVTVICDRFDTPNLDEKTITLYKPQIVNVTCPHLLYHPQSEFLPIYDL